jgi:hypothetical protein
MIPRSEPPPKTTSGAAWTAGEPGIAGLSSAAAASGRKSAGAKSDADCLMAASGAVE